MKNRIRELREERKLTQRELGLIVGLDASTVSKHEDGSRNLQAEQVRRYADVFKIETFELFIADLEGEAEER